MSTPPVVANMWLVPNDKDAKLKMNECEKLVRKIEFLAAIEEGDPPSAAEGLDLSAISKWRSHGASSSEC
jgi:PPP5 TPR repeat region